MVIVGPIDETLNFEFSKRASVRSPLLVKRAFKNAENPYLSVTRCPIVGPDIFLIERKAKATFGCPLHARHTQIRYYRFLL